MQRIDYRLADMACGVLEKGFKYLLIPARNLYFKIDEYRSQYEIDARPQCPLVEFGKSSGAVVVNWQRLLRKSKTDAADPLEVLAAEVEACKHHDKCGQSCPVKNWYTERRATLIRQEMEVPEDCGDLAR